MNVVLADLGIGNIHSLSKGLARQGARVEVSDNPQRWLAARALVLPGVGSFDAGMAPLEPVRQALAERLRSGVPCLGVCLGMQLMHASSKEGASQGMGLFDDQVERIPPEAGKVPHMGWTRVRRVRDDSLLDGIEDGAYFYFVHSYFVRADAQTTIASAVHGPEMAAVVRKGNTVGTQFHPEKSAGQGLRLLGNWLAEAEALA